MWRAWLKPMIGQASGAAHGVAQVPGNAEEIVHRGIARGLRGVAQGAFGEGQEPRSGELVWNNVVVSTKDSWVVAKTVEDRSHDLIEGQVSFR